MYRVGKELDTPGAQEDLKMKRYEGMSAIICPRAPLLYNVNT